MATVIPQGKSKEDVNLPHQHLMLLLNWDKSSRSSSPTKNRYTLPILSKVDNDIRSVVSSSNELTREQLRLAAKSPIAKKLHVISRNPNSPGSPNKYIIPVPFTLNLPPKLSSSNVSPENSTVSSIKSTPQNSRSGTPTQFLVFDKSPGRSKPKQSKLVYTSRGYEKVDTSLESEGEIEDQNFSISSKYQEDLNKRIALAKRPVPEVSNLKINKGFRDSDELSVIEEVSINGSRKSSMFSKLMTALKEDDEEKKENQPIKLQVPVPVKPKLINTEPLIVSIQVSQDIKSNKALPHVPKQGDVRRVATQELLKTNTSNINTPTNLMVTKHKYNKSLPEIPTARGLLVESEQLSPIPKSDCAANLKIISKLSHPPNNGLKIHKRNFSDDSLISSVSSFSSVGNFMHLARLQTMSPPSDKVRCLNLLNPQRKPPQQQKSQLRILPNDGAVKSGEKQEQLRELHKQQILKSTGMGLFVQPPRIAVERQTSISSTSSMDSLESTNSWDSIQKSIDITYSQYEDGSKENIRAPKKLADDDSSWLDTSDSSEDEEEQSNDPEETKPLKFNRQETTANENKIKLVIADNDGPGRSFHFPNDNTNITNCKEVKSRVIHEVNRKSRYSFYSNDGHIEIPSLTDKRVIDEYSEKTPSSYNGTTFSEIRTESSVSDCDDESEVNQLKIGVPGKEALRHLKQQYDSIGGESDTEFTTNITSLNGTNKETQKYFLSPIPQTELQCNLVLPARQSPPKHTRRKSMFNIDFNISNFAKNLSNGNSHLRNKSVDLFSEVSTFGKEQNRVKSPSAEKSSSPSKTDINMNKSPSEESIKPLLPHKNTKPQVVNTGYDELLNIKVAEPPKIVNYEVDFKESNSNGEDDFGTSFLTPTIISKSVERPLKVNPEGERRSSNQILRKVSPNIHDQETESVVIDLTKDKYEVVCMIDRSGSTRSYKSTTETIDGKDVEVVLVDDEDEEEDDEDGKSDKNSNDDELLSIYSKYRNNTWLFRNNSTVSSRASNTSNSGSVIHHKKPIDAPITRELNLKRSSLSMAASSLSSSSVSYQSNRIHHPVNLQQKDTTFKVKAMRHQSMPQVESHYFDYASNEKYNFNTFIQQRKLSEKDI